MNMVSHQNRWQDINAYTMFLINTMFCSRITQNIGASNVCQQLLRLIRTKTSSNEMSNTCLISSRLMTPFLSTSIAENWSRRSASSSSSSVLANACKIVKQHPETYGFLYLKGPYPRKNLQKYEMMNLPVRQTALNDCIWQIAACWIKQKCPMESQMHHLPLEPMDALKIFK